MVRTYNNYTAGFLPHEGGINDQTAIFSDVMQLFGNALQMCSNKKQSKG